MTNPALPRPAGAPRPAVVSDGGRLVSVEAALVLLALFGAAFGSPTLVSNFTFADIAIAGLIFLLAADVVAGRAAVTSETHQLLLPVLLVLLGSVLATSHVGPRPWVINDLLRDVGALATLFATVNVLRHLPARFTRPAVYTVAAGTAVLATQLAAGIGGPVRSSATFPNPNIPGHFLATAIGLLAWTTHGWLRIVTVTVAFAGLLATGSFGAALQLSAMVGYLLVAHRRRVLQSLRNRSSLGPLAVMAVVLATVAFLGLGAASSEDRFDRSSSGRLQLWGDTLVIATENPVGVGPGTIRELGLLSLGREPHSEYLAFVAERGLIGLAGLALLGLGLFRLGRPGGPVRMLVIGFAIASVFRETLHYRHIWLFLALLYAWEEVHPRRVTTS